jgi:hypothetical protein
MALNVDFEEESGRLEEFVELRAWFTDDQGNKLEHTASEIGKGIDGILTLTWHAWISQPANGYFLHFPTGEVIDLTPLLSK